MAKKSAPKQVNHHSPKAQEPEPVVEPTPVEAAPEQPSDGIQEYPRLMWHKRTGEEITVRSAQDATNHADEYQDQPVPLSGVAARMFNS